MIVARDQVLTGLLPATGGAAPLFGKAVNVGDMRTRARVGYMSQSFSLYTELTVRQNLSLHAHLFHLPPEPTQARITDLMTRFGGRIPRPARYQRALESSHFAALVSGFGRLAFSQG